MVPAILHNDNNHIHFQVPVVRPWPYTCPIAQQKRTCKIMPRILHARLAWHVHAICPFSCTILAQSCTYLARNGARFCKSCCKNNYLHFLHILCKILQELVQDCARIVQEKGHIACTSCMQDSCKIFAQSCIILQVRFCWVG